MPISLTHYAAVYALALVALIILVVALVPLAGISDPTILPALLPSIIASTMEGRRVAKIKARPYDTDEKWRASFRLAGVACAINAVVTGIFLIVIMTEVGAAMAVAVTAFAFSAMAFLFLATLLINRMFLGFWL